MGRNSGGGGGGSTGVAPKNNGDSSYKGKVTKIRDLVTVKDKAVYKELKQGISRYHAVMGVRERNVYIGNMSSRVLGVQFTAGGKSARIVLNAKYFDKKKGEIASLMKKGMDSGWHTKTAKPVQHTVTHELAHATWNRDLGSSNAKAAGKEVKKLFNKWLKDKTKKGYGQYSTTNVDEFWAETVTKAVHGKADKYTRAVKKIVKKYKL